MDQFLSEQFDDLKDQLENDDTLTKEQLEECMRLLIEGIKNDTQLKQIFNTVTSPLKDEQKKKFKSGDLINCVLEQYKSLLNLCIKRIRELN